MPLFQFGPAGGTGGNRFDDKDRLGNLMDQESVKLGILRIRHGAQIDAIGGAIYIQQGQNIADTDQHGGNGGASDEFRLNIAGGEKLVQIFGSLLSGNTAQVRGIVFVTNFLISDGSNRKQPFGNFTTTPNEQFFFTAPPGGEIIAFFGNSGSLLDAIGVWVRMP